MCVYNMWWHDGIIFTLQNNFVSLVNWLVNKFGTYHGPVTIRHWENSDVRDISCPQRVYNLMCNSGKDTSYIKGSLVKYSG